MAFFIVPLEGFDLVDSFGKFLVILNINILDFLVHFFHFYVKHLVQKLKSLFQFLLVIILFVVKFNFMVVKLFVYVGKNVAFSLKLYLGMNQCILYKSTRLLKWTNVMLIGLKMRYLVALRTHKVEITCKAYVAYRKAMFEA